MEIMHPDQSPSPAHDKHTIETPEQMALEFAVAGVGSRFLALAIDTLIQIVAGFGVLIVVGVSLGLGGLTDFFQRQSVWLIAAVVAAIFLLNFGYYAIFEVLWNGQTPGKRKVGIRVIKESGRPLTAAETIGRNFLRILDQLPGFYALGFIVALLNDKNKRLGDFIAGSLVVRETPFESLKPAWQIGGPASAGEQAASTRLSLADLTLEDLTLIETFLRRRYELAPDVRSRMAGKILEQLKDKVTVPPGEISIETLLESLARERRSTGGYS